MSGEPLEQCDDGRHNSPHGNKSTTAGSPQTGPNGPNPRDVGGCPGTDCGRAIQQPDRTGEDGGPGVSRTSGTVAKTKQPNAEAVIAKAAVRDRDGYACVECGMTNEEHVATFGSILQVHRLVPGSHYTLDGCVTLCIPCHGPKPRSVCKSKGERQSHHACPFPGSGVPVNLRIDPDLHALIPKFRAKFRQEHDVRLSMTDVFEKALSRLFRESGLEVPED